ncbi:hypothetical protein OG920_07440 [Streptomyces europaeiscabiei]|uniref:hypothetical protein n=1 Tax=Streptomyces TaxID=1883 RepID=UPI000A3D3AB4|nr:MULTISPECIES: hypothetical protein [Streptomyces]MDX3587746.1 hypothetical protein [Streptomyces europaeiscabiei]MDX3616874.1 hypothetical protein [Streptomyces europaeiscabiei]MDX3630317.1 hypothetical protein [Streptomyces europaeiscabiei]MDX3652569.1 hypothetical protein [Streptomyces europaeiscabiei]WUD31290.1 hypothetical protein OG858_07650 [Streptomyces europaeiscabiei]
MTLDVVSPSYTHVPRPELPEAVAVLLGEGCGILADGVGDGDVPLRLPVDLGPDSVGLDASPPGDLWPCERFGSSVPARPGEAAVASCLAPPGSVSGRPGFGPARGGCAP